ncbi:MAG TPA: hypothetical protein VNI01_12895 [Elusimicrobiota bacterium]|jgi:hypothetical protein|nr:hypothetical protein [Elusimicrobiota bacterium]
MSLRAALAALSLLAAASPVWAAQSKLANAKLWQERFFWDGMTSARSKAARVSADPRLLEVVNLLAHQVAQQALNVQQIQSYAKAQVDNVRFAFNQEDPGPSLAVIQNNFTTLGKGTEQIRNNLYYLTTRTRLCSSQALPDPKLTQQATILIAQIQNVQLKLNALYLDTASVARMVRAEQWGVDQYFRYNTEYLLNTVVSVQDSVFSVYNSAYELYLLSR